MVGIVRYQSNQQFGELQNNVIQPDQAEILAFALGEYYPPPITVLPAMSLLANPNGTPMPEEVISFEDFAGFLAPYLPPSGVATVNGISPDIDGNVEITPSDIGLGNVDDTSDADKPISNATQAALDLKQDDIAASNNQVVYQNGSGIIEGFPDFFRDPTSGGISFNANRDVDDNGNFNFNGYGLNLSPLQDSPNEKWTMHANFMNFDYNNSGFNQGINGQAGTMMSNNFSNIGLGDIGEVNFFNNYFNLGNGTDPVSMKGFSYAYGFGNINANAHINGPMQGYGFQPNFNAAATIDPSAYVLAFYDFSTFPSTPNYTSFAAGPTIEELKTNSNYNGFTINPTIDAFIGNAGFFGINITPTLGDMSPSGACFMINVNPTIDLVYTQAYGLYVNMDNVTLFPGVQSDLVFQDLTLTFTLPGNNNNFTLEYTPGATAGSEVVSVLGNTITVQIQSGVSTALQVKTALEANLTIASNLTIVISGVGSNPQVTAGPTNFVNGVNPGSKKAAYFDGDVEITGSLAFSGGLSIGALNAFGQYEMVDGSGNPVSTQFLITNPFLGDNETITNADYLGVNTAMLLQIGDNSTVTTAFLGVTALGLPAVLTMGSGSTIDRVGGAAFALSLDSGATGGTIGQLSLCRALAIPNGITGVTRLYGYEMDLPFGDPATDSWGFYSAPDVHNYFRKNLLIGGTPVSDDKVTNDSVAFEIKSTTKAVVDSRMTTAERDLLTAINGMRIYNTTTDKFQGYAGGSWVDFH